MENKVFEPAHSETRTVPTMIGKIVVPMERTFDYDDTYKLVLRGKVGKHTRLYTVEVEKAIYDTLEIGDYFGGDEDAD